MTRAWLMLGVAAAVQSPETLSPPALNEMVETERAFAALGAAKGVHESFFQYFGEEGISFNPHPEKFRAFARRNPPPDPPPPREFKLEWWPVYGDVADSGDLGYNTGPTLFTDLTEKKRPSGHGYFFSVWKKHSDGTWQVAVDMGANSPGPDPAHQDRLRYQRAPQRPTKKIPPRGAAQGRSEILELESRFGASLRGGVRDGYLSAVDENARLHRVNSFPMLGKTAIGNYFTNQKLTAIAWEGIDGAVAASGELGYSYGRYELEHEEEGGAKRTEKGYFTHVWKRDGAGEWKLVADVTSPLKEGQ